MDRYKGWVSFAEYLEHALPFHCDGFFWHMKARLLPLLSVWDALLLELVLLYAAAMGEIMCIS